MYRFDAQYKLSNSQRTGLARQFFDLRFLESPKATGRHAQVTALVNAADTLVHGTAAVMNVGLGWIPGANSVVEVCVLAYSAMKLLVGGRLERSADTVALGEDISSSGMKSCMGGLLGGIFGSMGAAPVTVGTHGAIAALSAANTWTAVKQASR